MTNVEKDLLIAYLVDAGDIDPDGDVEGQFLDWYRVPEGVVPGEVHYKAILDAARVRERSYQRGYRHTGDVGGLEGDSKPRDSTDRLADGEEVCDHGDPCGCYAEGYAAGRAEARAQHHRDHG